MGERAGCTMQQVDVEVHFEPRRSLLLGAPSDAGRKPSGHAIPWCPRSSGSCREPCRRASATRARHKLCPRDPQRHCDEPHTPPAWREPPPNCWIFRKILARLQGFSPAAAFEEQGVGLAGDIPHLPARGCPGWYRYDQGQTKGASLTTATRRSVIFRPEGLELRLTFCTAASSVSSAQRLAPATAGADRRKPRRPSATCAFMRPIL